MQIRKYFRAICCYSHGLHNSLYHNCIACYAWHRITGAASWVLVTHNRCTDSTSLLIRILRRCIVGVTFEWFFRFERKNLALHTAGTHIGAIGAKILTLLLLLMLLLGPAVKHTDCRCRWVECTFHWEQIII